MSWLKGLDEWLGVRRGEWPVLPPKMPLDCAVLPVALMRPIPAYVEPILCEADRQVSNKYFYFPEIVVSCCFMSWRIIWYLTSDGCTAHHEFWRCVYSYIVCGSHTIQHCLQIHQQVPPEPPLHNILAYFFKANQPLKMLVAPEFWMFVPQQRDFHLRVLSLAGKVFPNLLGVMKAASSLPQPSETSVCKRANHVVGLEIGWWHGPVGLKWFFIYAALIVVGQRLSGASILQMLEQMAVVRGQLFALHEFSLMSHILEGPVTYRSSHWC